MRYDWRKVFFMSGLMAGLFFSGLPAGSAQEFPKGQIVDKVLCDKDNQFSYALYLPSAYSAEKEWPLIVCFDPRAQGRRPVELLHYAAEAYGYIVAGSLDSKNGPLEPSQQAAKAVWADIRERFAIDQRRVYAAGFSGGAEVAVLFPYFVETRVAGIISCGAGLPSRHEPQWVKPASYCGIIGNLDFRYWDMARLEEPFAKAGVTHRIIFFDGWHQWPSAELLGEAVEWLELIAMKSGLKAKETPFIAAEYQKRLIKAQTLEAEGRLVRSVIELEGIVSDFKELLDISGPEKKVSEIKGRPEYQKMEREKRAAEEKELVLQPRTLQVFANFDQLVSSQATVRLKDIVRALGVDALLADSSQNKDVFRSEMAKRILSQVAILADQRGFRTRDAGNFPVAVLCFELAVKSSAGHPMNPGEYYNLAAAYTLWGKTKDALKNLGLAVEKGFDDLEFLENDRDFDTLRGTEEYKTLVSRLNPKKETAAL
jgi:tetratricopeptide (TPR) repeat protein